jgi:hypothetical protein
LFADRDEGPSVGVETPRMFDHIWRHLDLSAPDDNAAAL